MEKDILDVTKTNYDFFISKYGIITDPEIAKQLLCITTNAWYVKLMITLTIVRVLIIINI